MSLFKRHSDASKLIEDPATTICTGCGNSVFLPKHPLVHCPHCHLTYVCRTLGYPRECPCGFQLWKWRLRNHIPELVTPFP